MGIGITKNPTGKRYDLTFYLGGDVLITNNNIVGLTIDTLTVELFLLQPSAPASGQELYVGTAVVADSVSDEIVKCSRAHWIVCECHCNAASSK